MARYPRSKKNLSVSSCILHKLLEAYLRFHPTEHNRCIGCFQERSIFIAKMSRIIINGVPFNSRPRIPQIRVGCERQSFYSWRRARSPLPPTRIASRALSFGFTWRRDLGAKPWCH